MFGHNFSRDNGVCSSRSGAATRSDQASASTPLWVVNWYNNQNLATLSVWHTALEIKKLCFSWCHVKSLVNLVKIGNCFRPHILDFGGRHVLLLSVSGIFVHGLDIHYQDSKKFARMFYPIHPFCKRGSWNTVIVYVVVCAPCSVTFLMTDQGRAIGKPQRVSPRRFRPPFDNITVICRNGFLITFVDLNRYIVIPSKLSETRTTLFHIAFGVVFFWGGGLVIHLFILLVSSVGKN